MLGAETIRPKPCCKMTSDKNKRSILPEYHSIPILLIVNIFRPVWFLAIVNQRGVAVVHKEDWRVVPWVKSLRSILCLFQESLGSNILLCLFQERLDKGLVLMMSKSNNRHCEWFFLRSDLLEESSVDEAVAQTNKR